MIIIMSSGPDRNVDTRFGLGPFDLSCLQVVKDSQPLQEARGICHPEVLMLPVVAFYNRK